MCKALYPLADAELEVDVARLQVQAAVSETLLVSVFLGTDIPDLGMLLQSRSKQSEEKAMVMIRCMKNEIKKTSLE